MTPFWRRHNVKTDHAPDPAKLPWPAVAADVLVMVLLLVSAATSVAGGWLIRLGLWRLSMRTPWRGVALAVVIAGFRYWLVPRPPHFPRLWAQLRTPLPLDEQQLFGPRGRRTWPGRIGYATVLVVSFTALVVALTWPQARDLYSVPDFGDPLFSIWRIAWVNHQLPRHPLALFDANIFYPERLTLTYSDSLIVPALMVGPLLWAGVHPVVAYNILLLSGFVLSGITTFLLVRALTGRVDAAIVSGAIFAIYPYRYEHYSHLELQMTMWMPLALWSLHRAMASGKVRDGLFTGLAFALQMLSSLYYGVFLSAYMTVLGVALWLGRGRPRRPLFALAAGALVAGVLVAPVASQYMANKTIVGERDTAAVQFYSAEGRDYRRSHDRSWTYYEWRAGGKPERQLFPRFTPLILSAVALYPPLSVARIGYAMALVLAVDGSLGLNGHVFPPLREHVAPFRGLRVPARFSILAGLTLAILSGYGAARLLRRAGKGQAVLAGAMLAAVILEGLPRMPLERVWREPPPIYSAIGGESPIVLAEFPVPSDDDIVSALDPRYMYFSTWHWNKLLNGNSGFFPHSYMEFVRRQHDFPSDGAIEYLKMRGVDYLTVHGRFMRSQERYLATVAALDRRADLELVATARWEGSESRLYRLRHGS
jgi:hypothetical protein